MTVMIQESTIYRYLSQATTLIEQFDFRIEVKQKIPVLVLGDNGIELLHMDLDL